MDKREQILQAASVLIAEYGLQHCPMSKIAAKAGCGAGTIYRYFETKEALIQELYIDLYRKLDKECLSMPKQTDVRGQFNHFWGCFYHYFRIHPAELALLDQLSASPAICGEVRETAIKNVRSQLQVLLEQGRQEGLLKSFQDDLLVAMTFGSVCSIAKMQQEDACLFNEPVALDDLLTMCWDAISVH